MLSFRCALLVFAAISAPKTEADHGFQPLEKTLEEVLRYDYLTNIDSSIDSMPDKDTLYRLVRYQPRHIHLAYGDNPLDMVITWSTLDNPNGTVVEFGKRGIGERNATGTVDEFIAAGSMGNKQYIHRVTLTNLEAGETYVYHCGSNNGWSSLYFFTAMQSGTQWWPRVAIYGDLGTDNAQSLSQLQQEVHRGAYDAIIHDGDFAYNMESSNGLVGDVFMEDIQSISAYVPYMTVPGNHERAQNFMQYKKRFTMPGGHESMFYSWNMGPVHFIGVNTEVYYDPMNIRNDSILEQYDWLRNDLQMATTANARSERPWIILYGHQPAYCTNLDPPSCLENTMEVRIGYPELGLPGLEDILVDYGVDLAIWAHEHSYERMFPLYHTRVYNGSTEEPYTNPGGLTHIITGSAGCIWEHDPFPEEQPSWSAFRTLDFGYSRLNIINTTHLDYEQVSIDKGNEVIDSFTLVRERHEAYGPFYDELY